MALFGLHTPIFGPLHPIIGKLDAGTGLSGFTQYQVAYGNDDGGLTSSPNLHFTGSYLTLNANMLGKGYVRTYSGFQIQDGYTLSWSPTSGFPDLTWGSVDNDIYAHSDTGMSYRVYDTSNAHRFGIGAGTKFNIANTVVTALVAMVCNTTLGVTGVTTCSDKVILTSSTEYIDQEDW